jgi:hypothetical protein
MSDPIINRSFECEGWCGEIIEIPAAFAKAFAYPNGAIRPGTHLLCDDCATWIEKAVTEAHAWVESHKLRAGKP